MGDQTAATRLDQALTTSALQAGAAILIREHRATAWHSATFAGGRHQLEASAPSGETLDRWLSRLDADTVRLPGHIVAQLSVGACDRSGPVTRFRLDGLTVAAG
jgi:hypothetical protein